MFQFLLAVVVVAKSRSVLEDSAHARSLSEHPKKDVMSSRSAFQKTPHAKSLSEHFKKDVMSSRSAFQKTPHAKSMSEPPKKDEWSSRSAFEKTLNARSVPSGWTCSTWWYDALDGCDCNCGVWDPDCEVDGQWLYGCPSQDYTCQNNWSSAPTCVDAGVPADWTCSEYYYNALDGCDCECGVWDPDCDVDGQWLYGCPSQDYTCQNNWSSPPTCTEPVPTGWTCSESWFDALDGCDCNCGAWDPDCDVDGQWLFGCPSQDYTCQNNWSSPPTCAEGAEAGVPADWTCSESYYNALDGCDCNCGAWDPDCDVDGQWLYGCPSQDYTCAMDSAGQPSCDDSAGQVQGICASGYVEAYNPVLGDPIYNWACGYGCPSMIVDVLCRCWCEADTSRAVKEDVFHAKARFAEFRSYNQTARHSEERRVKEEARLAEGFHAAFKPANARQKSRFHD